jgi:hypothetical protein
MLSSETSPARGAKSRFLSVFCSVLQAFRQSRPVPSISVLQASRQSLPLLAAAWLVLAVPSLALSQPVPSTVTTTERVVAVVDGRPLLLSDARAMEHVRGLAEADALEALVDERLMHLEAARLPQAEVLAEEEQRATDELLTRRPELASAVPAPDLRRLVVRQIAILKYVEFRFRPQLRVSDEEVRAAFEADPSAGDSWEASKQEIRERLERRALDERVEAWVRELRARADVRYVGRPGADVRP